MKTLKFAALAFSLLHLVVMSTMGVASPKVIRVGSAYGGGYGKPFSSGTIGIVHARGLLEQEFKKDGIKIDWFFFKGAGPATNEAIANSTLDFAAVGDLPSIVARASGIKTKLIAGMSLHGNVYIAVPSDSRAQTLEDLKGKKVALFRGTNAQLTWEKLLASKGLTEKDFRVFNLGTADAEAALASKDIDAAVYWNGLINLQALGTARIIYSTKNAPLDLSNTGALFVTDGFAKRNPDIVKRVVKVYVEAAQWGSEKKNRAELIKLLAKGGTPVASIKADIRGTSLALIHSPLLDDFLYHHYEDGVSFLKKRGLIRRTFDVKEWFDPSYLNAALKELNLEHYWKSKDANGNYQN